MRKALVHLFCDNAGSLQQARKPSNRGNQTFSNELILPVRRGLCPQRFSPNKTGQWYRHVRGTRIFKCAANSQIAYP